MFVNAGLAFDIVLDTDTPSDDCGREDTRSENGPTNTGRQVKSSGFGGKSCIPWDALDLRQ